MTLQLIIFILLCNLFGIRAVRIFLRTGLKGELVQALGIILFLVSYLIRDYYLAIAGFVVFNIGLIISSTFENEIRREMFSSATLVDKLFGNVPQIDSQKAVPSHYSKILGVITGIICLLTAFVLYLRVATQDYIEITFIWLLGLTGIYFIIYSIFKKTRP